MGAISLSGDRRILSMVMLGIALAGYIAIVYLLLVVAAGSLLGLGSRNGLLTLGATSLVAVTFEAARERVRRGTNRLLYGERATPLEVLAQFSRGVAETAAGAQALEHMARLIADGTGGRSEVWIRTGDNYSLAASHPPSAPHSPAAPEGDLVAEVRYQGETLGALAVRKSHGEPATPTERRLLEDVASQAGLALRNFRLTNQLAARVSEIGARAEELRASRRRVVAAQDAERRRLERDIHDGAQQHLVALSVKLRLAQTLIKKQPESTPQLLDEVRHVTGDALETLRDLSRGIYPPVLAEHGIAVALTARTERSPIPVVVAPGDLRRYPPAIEAAVYFTCLEAIQNAFKHSRATRIEVSLDRGQRRIAFAVADDGVGFDPSAAGAGTGLQNLSDRLAAFGGNVRVESSPGRGTTISGEVPAAAIGAG